MRENSPDDEWKREPGGAERSWNKAVDECGGAGAGAGLGPLPHLQQEPPLPRASSPPLLTYTGPGEERTFNISVLVKQNTGGEYTGEGAEGPLPLGRGGL